jgi:hypothetical protein
MAPSDREFQAWARDWVAYSEGEAPAEVVRRHVRKRTMLLRAWQTLEVAIGAAAVSTLSYCAVSQPGPSDRLAMGTLDVVAIAATAFALWNWREGLKAGGETTRLFIELSRERCRLLRRAIKTGWVILAAEVAVFVAWVAHHVGWPSSGPAWPWGLLAGLVGAAALGLGALEAGARRETDALDGLAREAFGEDAVGE